MLRRYLLVTPHAYVVLSVEVFLGGLAAAKMVVASRATLQERP